MLRLLTELRMFEKVTVTDAMAEDMDKLRPRLKNVHIRELVVAIIIMPKYRRMVRVQGMWAGYQQHPCNGILSL